MTVARPSTTSPTSPSRRDKAEIRELRPEERERYSARWTDVQAAFVDDPVTATRDADDLVGKVMRDRGYPVDDVENRADLVATDHAELAGHYRAAHEVGQRADNADDRGAAPGVRALPGPVRRAARRAVRPARGPEAPRAST